MFTRSPANNGPPNRVLKHLSKPRHYWFAGTNYKLFALFSAKNLHVLFTRPIFVPDKQSKKPFKNCNNEKFRTKHRNC